MTSILEKIEQAFAEVSGTGSMKEHAQEALAQHIPPLEILGSMRKGLAKAGAKYERGEYFLSELVMTGIMAQDLSIMLKPYLQGAKNQFLAKVVIGTVKGDLHDIGKNLVSVMLSSAGFQVLDLGVDAPPERFTEAIERDRPRIVAFSCLLTIAMDAMKTTIDRLERQGFRKEVRVLVGGRPITSDFARLIGADGYGADAIEAVSVAKAALAK